MYVSEEDMTFEVIETPEQRIQDLIEAMAAEALEAIHLLAIIAIKQLGCNVAHYNRSRGQRNRRARERRTTGE